MSISRRTMLAALPANLKFGNTHGIVADAQGRLIVCHTVHKSSESGDAIAIHRRTIHRATRRVFRHKRKHIRHGVGGVRTG